jgi:hypothetical protein
MGTSDVIVVVVVVVVDGGAGESGSKGLGGGAMVNVEVAEEDGVEGDEVDDVDSVLEDEETDVGVVLDVVFATLGIAFTVPVAVVGLESRNEDIQPSRRGWYSVTFADLDAGGVWSGRGFQSKEWYSHATVWLVALGFTRGKKVVRPARRAMPYDMYGQFLGS